MRTFLIAAAAVGIVASATSVGFSQAKPSATPSIEGVWMGTSTIVTGANAANSVPKRQPNIFIYTKGYYTMITMGGTAPRPVLAPPKDPAKLTDAEKLARYEHWLPLGATSGRYEVKGTTLYQYPLVAKNQSAEIVSRNQTGSMGTVTPNSEITFQGNNTMVQIPPSADGKTMTRRTYTRLDQPRAAGTKPHPIEGVWKGTSVVVTGANASSPNTPQPNIYIYTSGYYSIMTQDGGAVPAPARPVLAPPKDPNKLTDAEKLARYEHWAPGVAQAGRYEVKGTSLYQYALVAKGQSADIITRNQTGNLGTVAPNSELVFSNGNNTMVRIVKSADGKTETRRTYTRLE